MAQIIQGIPIIPTEGADMITSTDKITAGYFTGAGGQLLAANIHSGTLADSNEKYYFNITQTHPITASAETQFSIAYGHAGGSGSNTYSDSIEGPTSAIYKQWANILLAENEVTGGFKISSQGSHVDSLSTGVRDEDIYILIGKRARFKDRINRKNWTIALSGSKGTSSGSKILYLTDDSNTVQATSTVAGPRYNIVSGSDGNAHSASSWKSYGWFYPDMGAMVFSATELSASIPGIASGSMTPGVSHPGTDRITASFVKGGSGIASESMGFSPNLDNAGNPANALRFINCLQPGGAYLKFRSEEDKTSVSYFCRVRSNQVNFSNNPTFVSGSQNELRIESMKGNPTVYATGIQLYNQFGDVVAVGKLSTPVKKNFSSEVTIKVKLDF
jgi:hypothetical protein